MRAVVFDQFGVTAEVRDVPPPECPPHGVIVEVRATGVCRSDWHGWMGHDDSIALPHVPGHEFAGVISEIGADVAGWSVGQRVTAPFVQACGSCEICREGRHSICPHQTQPGFTKWGSFAELVTIDHAEINLVALPDEIDDATAAGLGCRFATSYRAVMGVGRLREGENVVVFGCGGVGLAAVMIAVGNGARVIAVDVSKAALDAAGQLGAEVVNAGDHTRDEILGLIDGAHLTIDALGKASLLADAIAVLRPGGRHVQVGLLVEAEANPSVDMGRAVALELEILGSHGMSAHDYPAMLADIASGVLQPQVLVRGRISLDQAGSALESMSRPGTPGITVVMV